MNTDQAKKLSESALNHFEAPQGGTSLVASAV